MANPSNRGSGTEQQMGHQPSRAAEQSSGGIMGTVKEAASGAASGVASAAETAWDATRGAAESVWDTTRGAAQSIASTAGDALGSARRFMGDYPFMTLAAGAAFGFLLTKFLRGSSSSRTTQYYG